MRDRKLLRGGSCGHDSSGRQTRSISKIIGDITRRNAGVEVVPVRVRLFNKLDLPAALPLLQSFLSLDRRLRCAELLEIYQPMDLISLRKSASEFFAML